MKKLLKSKKGLALLATMIVAVAAAVGAYAYWTQGGSGDGSATAGTTTDITVNQTSLTASDLYPGGPAENLSGNFDNPNDSPVNIGSITAEVTSVTGGATSVDLDHPACTTDDFEIGGTSGANTVPSGLGVGSWDGLTISLKETDLNQDNCKNATAHITYTANAGV